MAENETDRVQDGASSTNQLLRVLLGIGLTLPASVACLVGMLLPTLTTFITSTQDVNLLGGQAEAVGMENFARLFEDPAYGRALGFTALLVAVRLLAVAILPVLLALGINVFGRAVRISTRLLFTIPLALYAPVALALSWSIVFNPVLGIVSDPLLARPETARLTVLLTDGLLALGVAAGLGLILYLAALRGPGEDAPEFKQVLPPLAAAWGIGLLATVALTLQSFTWSYTLTSGGPLNSTLTLALYQYEQTFRTFRLGVGAASSALPLLVILLLGLIAGLIVVLAGLRIDLVQAGKSSQSSGSRALFGVIAVLALLCGIVACALNAGVLPAALISGAALPGSDNARFTDFSLLGRSFVVNTVLLSALVVFVFQIPVTFLAALGIGGLRLLGRRSEWLLILFSPWFFVLTGPLMGTFLIRLQKADLFNTLGAVAGPFWISVPILVILTLFFKGRQQAYQDAINASGTQVGAFFRQVIVPALPLALLLGLGAWLIRMQRLQWPLTVASDPELFTAPVSLLFLAFQYGASFAGLGSQIALFAIPVGLFFLIAFEIFQIVYLDRLALVRDESETS